MVKAHVKGHFSYRGHTFPIRGKGYKLTKVEVKKVVRLRKAINDVMGPKRRRK